LGAALLCRRSKILRTGSSAWPGSLLAAVVAYAPQEDPPSIKGETNMKQMMLIAAATLTTTLGGCATPASQPSAQQQAMQQELPPGRVYILHSAAQAGCPALDWHIVLQAGGILDGMVSWNNMQSFARASGNVTPQRAFHMNAVEVGGQGRTATIDGTVNPQSGWLIANIQGPNVNCQDIQVPWFVPQQKG
jgi:hypothetical protein